MNRIIYSFFNGGCSEHIFNYYIFKRSKKESNIYFNFLTFLERKKLRLVEGNIIKHIIFKKERITNAGEITKNEEEKIRKKEK